MKIQTSKLMKILSGASGAEEMLILCFSFCIGMLAFRMIYTGNVLFGFLAWNLFLAFVPYFFSSWIEKNIHKPKLILLAAVLSWLVFIPNTFYILTDLFHLDRNNEMPLWYDLALILSFAWNGLFLGILSVRQMERVFEKYFRKKSGILFILPVMTLNGLGVFVGRYLRFNSWDIFADPFQLMREMLYLFIHPIRNRFDWSMIVCYTVLLSVMYFSVKKLSKVL
ncbi:MAG: DUF1361 domain-containing protein [Flavisolibacter sp.]|jgi:uncharacterized membrane protein